MSHRQTIRTVKTTVSLLLRPRIYQLDAPAYTGHKAEPKVMMAVESMKRHTADAGWQLQVGLRSQGYQLCGYGFNGHEETDTKRILEKYEPNVLVIQDKREWEGRTANNPDGRMRFRHIECLKDRTDILKLTVLKDAQQKPGYHRCSADEMAIHGWIIYYHPTIVKHVAPYVRREHCIRTYHSVDPDAIPTYTADRCGCLLSGARSKVYPLRSYLIKNWRRLPDVNYLPHPGYHARGCVTPQYLRKLSRFKVALCTSSQYGYALRKIIEATACGCVVITDLPSDEVLPEIDENLIRVSCRASLTDISKTIKRLCADYEPERQRAMANQAQTWYDWRAVGKRLADNIEQFRRGYNA